MRATNPIVYGLVGALAIGAVALVAIALIGSPMHSVGADPAETARPFPVDDPLVAPEVVFIGDSFTGGSDMGGRGDSNWTVLAAHELGWASCVFGVGGSGWTRATNGWTYGARIDWALSMRPSAIVFANGINDFKDGTDDIAPALDQALSYLRSKAPDLPVVYMGPIKVNDSQSPRINEVTAQIRGIAAAHDVTFIDAADPAWFAGDMHSYIGSDNFHPTDEGHKYLASKFVEALTATGVHLDQVPNSSRAYCSIPKWQSTRPDGSTVIRTPEPTDDPDADDLDGSDSAG